METASKAHGNRRHGYFGTRIYQQWADMWRRCTNPRCEGFKHYGARGIRVCDAWKDFVVFLRDMGECPEGLQLDREDTDGDYTPENCRWSTRRVNTNNRRNTMLLTVDGRTQGVTDWAREVGMQDKTIAYRVRHGWTHTEAVRTPPGAKRCQISPQQE
jgi:hypothetical protein